MGRAAPPSRDQEPAIASPTTAPEEPAPPRALKRETISGSLRIVMVLTVIQRAFSLVRQAVFTRLLGPASFGALGLAVDAIMGTPLNVVTLGIPSTYSRYIQQYERKGRLSDFLLRTLRPTLIFAPLAAVAMMIAAPQVSEMVFGNRSKGWLIAIAALSIVPEALNRHLRAAFAGMRLFKMSSAMDFMPVALFSVVGVVVVVLFSRTAEFAAGAQTLAAWATVAAFGWILWRQVRAAEPKREAIEEPEFNSKIFRFSSWSFFVPLLMHLLTLVDRTMLAHMRTLNDVGIYNTASNVSDYVFLFGALTVNVLAPSMSRMWEEGDHGEVIRRINMALRATLLVLLGLALFLLGVSPRVIPLICGPAYAASAKLMWIFVVYQLFYSAFYVVGIFPYISEKPRMNLVAVAVGLAANVGLNMLWIPPYGTGGAAAAALASMILMVAILLGQSMASGFRLEWRSLLVLVLLLLPMLQHRAVLLAVYLALIVVVMATGWILHPGEKQMLRERLVQAFRFRSDE